jgi:hypothetical protein
MDICEMCMGALALGRQTELSLLPRFALRCRCCLSLLFNICLQGCICVALFSTFLSSFLSIYLSYCIASEYAALGYFTIANLGPTSFPT